MRGETKARRSGHAKPVSLDELRQQLKVLRDYWMRCQVPEVAAPGTN